MENNVDKINKSLGGAIPKAPRSSNLELYRIICMIMIVAHHYVVNSGVADECGPLAVDENSVNSIFLLLFGAWGKTGINCFLMITGYFMCTSKITLRKFIKLIGQIYLYNFLLFVIFYMTGYETISLERMLHLLMLFWGFSDGFVSCFIIFWLAIPFLSILVHNMNKRQHQLLLILTLGVYTICGSLPTFNITFNYINWFCVLFFIASYIRLYPHEVMERRSLWAWMTLVSVLLAILSILCLRLLFNQPVGQSYRFVSDSNKIFAVIVAVCSFLWFKNLNIKYSKIINGFGAGTFGVLLIHANSDAMRKWLWADTVDVIGHYSLPFGNLVFYSVGVVLSIFVVCNLIDQLRIATLESVFLKWYDSRNVPKVLIK